MNKRNRLLRYILWFSVLCVGFVLCRYILFSLHGMREWPVVLFAVGMAALFVSFFAKAKYVPAVTSIAYTLAFGLGALFQSNGVDPGGGRTNNLWIIWTVTFIGIISVSVVLELFTKKKR